MLRSEFMQRSPAITFRAESQETEGTNGNLYRE